MIEEKRTAIIVKEGEDIVAKLSCNGKNWGQIRYCKGLKNGITTEKIKADLKKMLYETEEEKI